ncbi:MAG: hypothetical protein LBP28_07940 [Coriobacteriales bacterium]|jgi:hypothetical protein|nr:hypothetical protein [Coriobacteriales bacterium]
MKNKTYRDYFLSEEAYARNKAKADKRIQTYDKAYMSNSKWKKLFSALFANADVVKHCEVIDFFGSSATTIKTDLGDIEPEKYIHNDCIDTMLLRKGEHPVSFREIEYLEFRKHGRNEEAKEGGSEKGLSEQDLGKIKEAIEKTGRYEWEVTEEYIRILGYNQ